jgi:glycosyltransferase involved in cell wall biosynthesis
MHCLLIGPVSGYQSYSVVCKGLIQGLIDGGLEVVAADTTWDGSGNHTEPRLSRYTEAGQLQWLTRTNTQLLLRGKPVKQELGSVCIALNPSVEMLNVHKLGMKLAGMHVGDVDKLPSLWKHVMEQEDVVLVPSQWMASIVRAADVQTPMFVVNHGVGPDFRLNQERMFTDPPPFVFLHPCAAVYYPERKGTPQALEAFSRLVDDGYDVTLRLVVGNKTKPIRKLIDGLPGSANERLQIYSHAGSRPQDDIAEAYRDCHALLAPSRAEGFGLIPLECRSLGTPVVQTMCTGHADHLDPDLLPAEWGVVVVKSGPLAPAWVSIGQAPAVGAADVYQAMRHLMDHYEELKLAAVDKAEAVFHAWQWGTVTAPLVTWVKNNS